MRKSAEALELKNIRERIFRKYSKNLNRPFNVIIPTSITNDEIESIRPNEIADPLYWKDCVFYLIHTIFIKTINEDFKTGQSKFVALNFAELKKVLGIHVTIVLSTLESKKIILKDNSYKMNVISYGYKIKKKYLKEFAFKYKTITSEKVCLRLHRYQLKYYEKQKPLLSKYAHLIKWFLEDDLDFNHPKSQLFFLALSESLTSISNELPFSPKERTKIQNKIKWFQSYNNLSLNNDLPVVSKKGERLYSYITGMYSPLRNFLTYKGHKLIYLDISNSQPFHFNILLKTSFWEENSRGISLKKIDKELYEWLKTNHKDKLDYIIMSLKQYESLGNTYTNKGIQRKNNTSPQYVYLSATGKLYLFIHENFKGNFFTKDNVDRFKDEKAAKQEFIQILYFNDKIKRSPSYKPFQFFKHFFSVEASIIEFLKLRKHNDFSILLQKIEAHMLLNLVGKEIFIENADVPIYTIHDGIITTISNEELVEQKINSVYKDVLGFTPDLKKEFLSEQISITDFRKIVEKKMNQILNDTGIKSVNYTAEIGLIISSAYLKYFKNH